MGSLSFLFFRKKNLVSALNMHQSIHPSACSSLNFLGNLDIGREGCDINCLGSRIEQFRIRCYLPKLQPVCIFWHLVTLISKEEFRETVSCLVLVMLFEPHQVSIHSSYVLDCFLVGVNTNLQSLKELNENLWFTHWGYDFGNHQISMLSNSYPV